MDKKEKLDNIIQGCLREERTSQEALFKFFYSKMLTICLRYTSDRDTAQELLQDGFIKVFEKLRVYENTGSFEGWVKRIIVNTCIDYYRKAKRNPLLYDDDTAFKDEDFELQNIDNEDLSELNTSVIMEEIANLSPAYRTVFNLFVIENYPHKEIAEMLGITEGTSKSNLAKAKMNLQKALQGKLKKEY
ncbi:MAG TPA: RNA polymerase sigma factor [Crocinitomicaceae bacterium]|nr:RNA polymerase sigma factor [Crocinitomicaceae bacterium]